MKVYFYTLPSLSPVSQAVFDHFFPYPSCITVCVLSSRLPWFVKSLCRNYAFELCTVNRSYKRRHCGSGVGIGT